jgi:hypothetical protein
MGCDLYLFVIELGFVVGPCLGVGWGWCLGCSIFCGYVLELGCISCFGCEFRFGKNVSFGCILLVV